VSSCVDAGELAVKAEYHLPIKLGAPSDGQGAFISFSSSN
jgi:hypothetical protein